MTHSKQISEMMSARLDGRLDSAGDAVLDAHLAECEGCRAEWRKMHALDCLFAAAPMAQAPVRVRVNVLARLERREKVRRALIGSTALGLGTVALALIVAAPILLGLLNTVGVAPALASGGPATLSQLLAVSGTIGRVLTLLAGKFAVPLVCPLLCGLALVLALNGLWIGTLRRTRAPH